MNKAIEILHKIFANQIEEYIEKIIHHNQVGFVLRIQGDSTAVNQ